MALSGGPLDALTGQRRHGGFRRLNAFDLGEYHVNRAPVVFRKVDLNPGEPAGADGMQRTPRRELLEGARDPRLVMAGLNESIQFLDQQVRAVRAELHDAQVLAV